MKTNRIFYSFLFAILSLSSFSQGVKFIEKPWEEILNQAKESNKPIFVDVYTTWCGPCKSMDKNVFPNERIGKLLNDSLICYKMDAELKQHTALCKKFRINSYPTYLFLSPQGNLSYSFVGAMAVDDFLREANVGLKECRDQKPLAMWEQEYKTKKADPAFMYDYIAKRKNIQVPDGKIIDDYFTMLPFHQRFTRENIKVLADNIEYLNVPGSAYKVLLTCRDSLIKRSSAEEADAFLDNNFWFLSSGILNKAAKARDEEMIKVAINVASKIRNPEMKPIGFEYQIKQFYYLQTDDFKTYTDITEEYMEVCVLGKGNVLLKDTIPSIFALNGAALNYFNYIDDKSALRRAIKWTTKSQDISKGNDPMMIMLHMSSMDINSDLLYKLGESNNALLLKNQLLTMIPEGETDFKKSIADKIAKMEKNERTW